MNNLACFDIFNMNCTPTRYDILDLILVSQISKLLLSLKGEPQIANLVFQNIRAIAQKTKEPFFSITPQNNPKKINTFDQI